MRVLRDARGGRDVLRPYKIVPANIGGSECGVGTRYFGTLVQGFDEVGSAFQQGIHTAAPLILHVEFKAARKAITRNHRTGRNANGGSFYAVRATV